MYGIKHREHRPQRQRLGGRLDHLARRRRPLLHLHLRDAEARLQLGRRQDRLRADDAHRPRRRPVAVDPARRSLHPRRHGEVPALRHHGAAADGHRARSPHARHGQRRHLRRRHDRAARRPLQHRAHRLQLVGSRQPRVAALARHRPRLHPDSVAQHQLRHRGQLHRLPELSNRHDDRTRSASISAPRRASAPASSGSPATRCRSAPAWSTTPAYPRPTSRVGLGYLSTAFGIDLSYRGKVQGGIENFLMLGIRIFID